jgi:hypothetical protein
MHLPNMVAILVLMVQLHIYLAMSGKFWWNQVPMRIKVMEIAIDAGANDFSTEDDGSIAIETL